MNKLVMVFAVVCTIVLSGCTSVSEDGTKTTYSLIQLSFWPEKYLAVCDDETSIYGLSLGMVSENIRVDGLAVATTQLAGEQAGVGVAIVSIAEEFKGISLAIGNYHAVTWGADVALGNFANSVNGFQIGLTNNTTSKGAQATTMQFGFLNKIFTPDYVFSEGGFTIEAMPENVSQNSVLQIGLYNSSPHGIQVGLLNRNEKAYFKYFPIFNFSSKSLD